MEMDKNEAANLIESAINPSQETAPTTQTSTQTPEEMLEYYLGDKANKLPLSAQAAFKENGKINKVPFSQVINGYRMNQKTAQQNAELLKGKSQWDMTAKELADYKAREEGFKPYKALQDWSVELETKNPVGYKYLMDQIDRVKNGTFQSAATEGQGYDSTALTGTIAELRQELQGLKEWKSQFDQVQESKKIEEDQKFVNSEIEDHKKKFPEINLDEVDENFIPLKTKVIDFGVEKGYQNFTDAFHAYFRDKLPDIFAQRGRTEATSTVKKNNALGIVARSSTPFTGHPIKADNDKGKLLAEFEAIYKRQ